MIEIYPAETNDIADIVNLSCRLFEIHRNIDPEYYQASADYNAKIRTWAEQQVNSPSQFLLVARDSQSKKAVGFISGYIKFLFPWYKIKSVGHISFLSVDPEWQKKGIGKQLNYEAEKWFSERGRKYIEVFANIENSAGVAAWKKYGYLTFNKMFRKKIRS